ncbi:uncharacterized protein LOC134814442 [Bolinopsis microptera]|uniref:uncharacterized protein LOC134814442 n=1 Tax=Bolinopsis microptera TaxID=2820187 RepID=UPI00307ABCEF
MATTLNCLKNMEHLLICKDCTDSVNRCQDRIELTKLKMKRVRRLRSTSSTPILVRTGEKIKSTTPYSKPKRDLIDLIDEEETIKELQELLDSSPTKSAASTDSSEYAEIIHNKFFASSP